MISIHVFPIKSFNLIHPISRLVHTLMMTEKYKTLSNQKKINLHSDVVIGKYRAKLARLTGYSKELKELNTEKWAGHR